MEHKSKNNENNLCLSSTLDLCPVLTFRASLAAVLAVSSYSCLYKAAPLYKVHYIS